MAAAAARAGIAGGPLVAVSAPLHMDEIEAEDDRVVDLFVAEIPSRAAALPKLKMRVDGLSEVFHQWELPEDQPEEELSLVDKLQRGAWRGRRIDQDLLSPVGFPSYYRGPPSFDIDEESTIQPGRHSAAPTAQLEWSANILSIKVLDSTVGYPIYLYGSVFVRDDLDLKRVYLFLRDRDNAQLVESPEEALILTGPSRGLVLLDNLFFEFDLKMRCDEQGDDMDFSQGRLCYDNRVAGKSMLVMDKLITKVSTVGIAYAPVDRAVEATIQIKVPEEFSMEFYGKFSCFITGIASEILLFDSEACGTGIKIGEDGIKLWRHVVSVPIHGSLLLRIDTWEGDSRAKLRRSSMIFTPQICGRDVSIHGRMQIKVTWSPVYICEYDDKLRLGVICDF